MIDRILDKYYKRKLKEYLDRELLFWFIDHRYIEDRNYLELQVKKETYNDKQYKEILTFDKQDIFIILCNQKELEKCLKERINNYLKGEYDERTI